MFRLNKEGHLGNLKGKVAIVTGAGRGMGQAIAHKMAKNGASVVLNDLDAETVTKATTDISHFNSEVISDIGDVSDPAYVEEMISRTLNRFHTVNILVNNAGVLRPTPIVDITEEEWDFVVTGNLKTTFLCSKSVIPIMQEKEWGRIINISSSAGKNISTIGGAHYTAAKAAVLGFTRHMAKEVAELGITVNAICPGLIDTEMVRSTITPQQTRNYAESFPTQRLGKPEEIADLVSFLSSEQAAYITGASIDINGGDLMI